MGNGAFLRILKKETNWENKKSFSKGKCKGNVKKTKSPQEAAGHNSVPSNKPYYCVSWSFMFFCLAETNPLESLWFWFQEQWS